MQNDKRQKNAKSDSKETYFTCSHYEMLLEQSALIGDAGEIEHEEKEFSCGLECLRRVVLGEMCLLRI